ncbi:Oxidoreductase [Dimargaris verticillata]|uniref:Mitochondrial intermembrane space import and assembly protein 40 n=1 Tax=Dimargaris verticillata TaxID=2761393 RepID=A0A9W8B3X4_9FUNG|nr:Oxidoreductase [Dimargaris verticillata]
MSTSRTENDKDIVIFLPPVDPDKPERPIDPETGEINWDCPCMQGYVHGPCGDAFRTAYSCYIDASSEDNALESCVDKFQAMQTCFEQYPEFYADDRKPGEPEDRESDDSHPSVSASASDHESTTTPNDPALSAASTTAPLP